MSAAVAQTSVVTLVVLVSNIATGVVLARALGAEGRGEFLAILLVPSLTSSMLTLGLPSALVFYMKREPADLQALLGATVLLFSALAVIGGAIGSWLVGYWLVGTDPRVLSFAQAYAWIIPLPMLSILAISVLEGQGNFKLRGVQISLKAVVILPCLIALWAAGWLDPIVAIWVQLLASFGVTLPLAVWVLRRVGLKFTNFRQNAVTLLSFGLRSWLGSVSALLGREGDKVLVVGFLTTTDLGRYAVALSVAGIAGMLQGSLLSVLFPKLAGEHSDLVISRSKSAGGAMVLIGIVLGVPLAFASPYLIPWAYGQDFFGLGWVVALLLIYHPVRGVAAVQQSALRSLGRPGLQSAVLAACTVLSVGAMAVSIAVLDLGLVGAGIALVLSGLAALVVTWAAYVYLTAWQVPLPWITRKEIEAVAKRLLRPEMDRLNTPAI